MSKGYRNLKEIEKECVNTKSCVASSDGFMYRCFPYMMRQLTEMNDLLSQINKKLSGKRKKRKNPSDYNLHMAEELAKGKTFSEAIESWKAKKK